MADVILALVKKRTALATRKRIVTMEKDKEIEQIDREIADIDKAIETLNNAISTYLCPECNGTGNIRRCDAAGDMEDDTCPRCRGTGVLI